jgi:predicted acylesterase/phospholipase RssA
VAVLSFRRTRAGHLIAQPSVVNSNHAALLAGFDLVLSSGFLAFANHCGFLAAVDEVGLPVNAVMGTSAGALSGSLYCAGYSPVQVRPQLPAKLGAGWAGLPSPVRLGFWGRPGRAAR